MNDGIGVKVKKEILILLNKFMNNKMSANDFVHKYISLSNKIRDNWAEANPTEIEGQTIGNLFSDCDAFESPFLEERGLALNKEQLLEKVKEAYIKLKREDEIKYSNNKMSKTVFGWLARDLDDPIAPAMVSRVLKYHAGCFCASHEVEDRALEMIKNDKSVTLRKIFTVLVNVSKKLNQPLKLDAWKVCFEEPDFQKRVEDLLKELDSESYMGITYPVIKMTQKEFEEVKRKTEESIRLFKDKLKKEGKEDNQVFIPILYTEEEKFRENVKRVLERIRVENGEIGEKEMIDHIESKLFRGLEFVVRIIE